MKIGIAGPIEVSVLKDYLDINPSMSYAPKGLGGTAINHLVKGFIQMGHTVSVYTLDPEVNKTILIEGPNLKIYIAKYRSNGSIRALSFFSAEIFHIRKMILRDKPDIVSAHWGYEFALGTIFSGCRYVVTLRDDPLIILLFHKSFYRLSRLMINILVRILGKNFIANSPYLSQSIHVKKFIPNSVQFSNKYRGKELTGSESIFKVVSIISGWDKRKNPIPLVKAIDLLHDKGISVSLDLYGPDFEFGGPFFKWCIKNLKYYNRISFHGKVDHQTIIQEMAKFHIMVHPALEESFGNTLIEAMAQGVPVIGGVNSGAVPWVLNYGKNGVLVDMRDENEISNAILKLIQDPIQYGRLSSGGITYVAENFSVESVCNKYLQMFKEILL
jgi:glycosyltransferase involved in cell wall biosynthesis